VFLDRQSTTADVTDRKSEDTKESQLQDRLTSNVCHMYRENIGYIGKWLISEVLLRCLKQALDKIAVGLSTAAFVSALFSQVGT